MGVDFQNYWMKQIIWYVIGFGLAYFMMFLGNKFLYNNAWWFYIVGVISLLLVLFIGKEINSAKCWFQIKYIGSIQPSEFMKVFLIIILSRLIRDFNDQYSNPSVNAEYKTHGIDKVVSCKTLKAQRDIAAEAGDEDMVEFLNRTPQEHLGPALAYKTQKIIEENGYDQENIDNTLDKIYQMSAKAFGVIIDKIQKARKAAELK